MELKVKKSERVYFGLKVVFTILAILGITVIVSYSFKSGVEKQAMAMLTVWIFYILMFVIYFKFIHFLMMGHLRGNGIQITENQFPEVFEMMKEISESYKMKKIPAVFLIQSGGVLNAYATRSRGRNYVAIYSEIFSMIEKDKEVLKFILAHEFAHIKRNHLQKRFWTILSFYIPFLGQAYSRSCEYTCDSYGKEISSEGAIKGLVLLAAGKEIYEKVDIEQYITNASKQNTISVKLAEKFFSHPNLPNRIKYIQQM